MKKFVALLSVLLCLAALHFADGKTTLALAYPQAAVTRYARGAQTAGGPSLLGKNDAAYTLSLDEGEAERVLELLSARVVSDYTIEGMRIVEAYSPLLEVFVTLPDGRVNVQIACKADATLVGLPMLVGGY